MEVTSTASKVSLQFLRSDTMVPCWGLWYKRPLYTSVIRSCKNKSCHLALFVWLFCLLFPLEGLNCRLLQFTGTAFFSSVPGCLTWARCTRKTEEEEKIQKRGVKTTGSMPFHDCNHDSCLNFTSVLVDGIVLTADTGCGKVFHLEFMISDN